MLNERLPDEEDFVRLLNDLARLSYFRVVRLLGGGHLDKLPQSHDHHTISLREGLELPRETAHRQSQFGHLVDAVVKAVNVVEDKNSRAIAAITLPRGE